MSDGELRTLDPCGCCQVPISPTPEEFTNRPGLSDIRYRVGSYSSFRQAMIEKSASLEVEADGRVFRPLRGWTTRAGDDYGIALLEMWSYLADILTFYQERIANEAFLRTARLPESVRRLAALLDYEPAPGVAATTRLALILEKDKQVRIPVGLRVQSVPGQDEKPQKFEVVEPVAADARLNQVRVFPGLQPDAPLEAGRDRAVLQSDDAGAMAAKLAPGDRLVFFATTVPPLKVEEKVVEAVEVTDRGAKLVWSPHIRNDLSGARIFEWNRKFRLFGYNAPRSYLKAEPLTPGSTDIRWRPVEEGQSGYLFNLDNVNALKLDALYDDLRVGTQVLVTAPDTVKPARIIGVEQVNATQGPLNDTVTQLTLSENIRAANLRTVTVYELGEEITFRNRMYSDAFLPDTVYVPSPQPALDRGRVLVLDDGQGQPQTVTCTGADLVGADGDGSPDHLRVTFTPDLTRTLNTETTMLYGNVALATHGETVAREVLGNGDAAAAFQSFQVRKSPVTFVPQPGASRGAASTLQVRVGGVQWKEVSTLYGHGGEERVYTARVDEEGVTVVRFGDGVTGARLPSGRDNVVAGYRQGLGRDGNVRANTLTTLLDRPVGLKSVTNLAGVENGANPETLREARANAPNTVRTFERIVSLRDFEDAAREFAGVAKARASWEWDGEEQVVHLTVAGDEGVRIVGEPLKTLVKDLDSRRDPNRELVVSPHHKVPVQVEASIKVHSDYVPEEVQATARKALENYFAFDNLELGQPIHLSDVYRTLQDVPGVVAVDIDRLNFKEPGDRAEHWATEQPVQGHLRIDPTELAFLERPTTDAVVAVEVGEP